MLADKGDDGDEVRQSPPVKRVMPIIPPKAIRRTPAACDFQGFRNRIERMFDRLKPARRIATRDDETASSPFAFLSRIA